MKYEIPAKSHESKQFWL